MQNIQSHCKAPIRQNTVACKGGSKGVCGGGGDYAGVGQLIQACSEGRSKEAVQDWLSDIAP